MRKVDQNKKQKKDSLLDAAFGLFMENGFHKTSISDIVNQAGVAKGTFYLYFTDKYDLRNKLISHKAIQVFSNAYNALLNTEIKTFEEQIIFIIDHILTQFQEDHSLVFFISKQKSNKNRLRRWDFCVQLSGFWHIHAKTPRGIVAPG